MKIATKKLMNEDFKDQSWISKLLSPLNDMLQQLQSFSQNNITIEDNLFRELKEIIFINNTGLYPINIKTKFNTPPKGINLIYCRSNTDNSLPSVQPLIDWEWANQNLKINSISGLTSSKKYTVRLEIIYG